MLKDKNKSLIDENTILKKENKTITDENAKLKSVLSGSMAITVDLQINSQDYIIQKVNDLIVLCEKTKPFLVEMEINSFITKLEQYKALSEAMNEAKKVLSILYDKSLCDKAVSLLLKVTTFNNNQSNQKRKFIELVTDYCNKTALCKGKVDDLKAFCPHTPKNIPLVIKEYLREIDEKYDYLRRELSEKLKPNNECYDCIFPNDCK